MNDGAVVVVVVVVVPAVESVFVVVVIVVFDPVVGLMLTWVVVFSPELVEGGDVPVSVPIPPMLPPEPVPVPGVGVVPSPGITLGIVSITGVPGIVFFISSMITSTKFCLHAP